MSKPTLLEIITAIVTISILVVFIYIRIKEPCLLPVSSLTTNEVKSCFNQ